MYNKEIKFSIIMASYNQANFIEEAIESILNQTYKNFELLIIDGNSSDNTHQIIKKYNKHPNIQILIEEDKGLYHARNKGLLLATGDVISFLNTDDYYQKDALEYMKICFTNNPDIDIFYGILNIVNKNGDLIKEYGNFEYNKERQIKKYITLPDPTSFIRAKYINYVGLYDLTFSIIADWDFWLKAMSLNLNIKNTRYKIANYRYYEETLTANQKFEIIRFQEIRRLYRKYNNLCFSFFIIKISYWFYIKRPLKKIYFLKKLYEMVKK